VVFVIDDQGHVSEMQFHQPDGVFSARPKEIQD
jgi:hypothetical protein